MATPLSLHSITLTKIRELEKLGTKYESRKKSVPEFAEKPGDDQRGRTQGAIARGVSRTRDREYCTVDGSAKVRYKISSVMMLSSKRLLMRFANIENWDCDAGQQRIPAMPRQQMRQGLGGDERLCQKFSMNRRQVPRISPVTGLQRTRPAQMRRCCWVSDDWRTD